MKNAANLLPALLILAAIPHSAFAQGVVCPPAVPELQLETPIPATTYRYEKNVTAIQLMMREKGRIYAGMTDDWILGVTFAEPTFTLDGEVVSVPEGEGTCTQVKSVKATFGYATMDVYIGSDFKPGTCAFKVIKDHEYEHVTINTYTLQEYAKGLKAALQEIGNAARGQYAAAGETGVDVLQPYRTRLRQAVQDFQQVQRSRNAALDTPQNYARTEAMCDDWNQSYTWTKKSPVQRAPAQPQTPAPPPVRRPVQRAPAAPPMP